MGPPDLYFWNLPTFVYDLSLLFHLFFIIIIYQISSPNVYNYNIFIRNVIDVHIRTKHVVKLIKLKNLKARRIASFEAES